MGTTALIHEALQSMLNEIWRERISYYESTENLPGSKESFTLQGFAKYSITLQIHKGVSQEKSHKRLHDQIYLDIATS